MPDKATEKTSVITCAIYCRYSSKSQDSGYSIDAQKEACLDYAKKQGWKVHAVYVDKALSGTSDDRVAFQEFIDAALSKDKPPFTILLVHKLDRFARNRYDSIRYKHVLKKRGVRVMSVTQPIIGSGDPTEVLLESLLEGMDEFYSLNLAREAVKGMIQNAKAGFWNGGNPPFGYRLKRQSYNGRIRSTLEIDAIEAKVVRQIFEMYAKGILGFKGIAMKLNERGIKPRSSRYWNKTVIERILSNEKYAGDIIFGKKQNMRKSCYLPTFPEEVAKDCHPGIIDRVQFEDVQRILRNKRKHVVHPRSHSDSFLLSGLITCGKCQTRYVGTTAKSGQYAYYICGTKNRHGTAACSGMDLRREVIETTVTDAVREKFTNPQYLKTIAGDLSDFISGEKERLSNEMAAVTRDGVDKQKRLNKLYEAIEKSNNLTIDDLGPRIRQLKEELESLAARETQYALQKESFESLLKSDKDKVLDNILLTLAEMFSEEGVLHNKIFLRELIDKIEIGDSQIDVFWRIPDLSALSSTEPLQKEVLVKGKMVSRVGLEPTTPALKGRCSAR
jgi:site-specific DNA recombinase